MRDMNVLFGRVAIVATALFALSASAGIKYWDNPAFRAFEASIFRTFSSDETADT